VGLLPNVGRLWSLARQTEDLFQLQGQLRDALRSVDERLRTIEDRLLQIETATPHIVDEARSAASAAATVMCGAALTDLITRLARIEMHLEGAAPSKSARKARRVAPPKKPAPIKK
jgi:hypothetical protein